MNYVHSLMLESWGNSLGRNALALTGSQEINNKLES